MTTSGDTLAGDNHDGASIASHEPLAEDDDWLDLPPPGPRRRVAPLTLALAVAIVAVAAFALGVYVQKGRGSNSGGGGGRAAAAGAGAFAGAARGGFRGGFGGGAGGAGAGGGGAAAGGAGTLGTVKTIQGSSLFVTSFTGNLVKVKTTAATRVTKTEQLTVQGVKPGDFVVVQGATQKDGSVNATSITLGGAGGAAGG
jgi:hypothetical protein